VPRGERRRRLTRDGVATERAACAQFTARPLLLRNLSVPRRLDYRRASHRATISPVACGCSAVGSASPCQGEGRGFESRHPLEGASGINPAVEWPSGEATACKAVHTGSIPVSTSRFVPPARLAQRESASLTRKRSLVQSQYRAPEFDQLRPGFHRAFAVAATSWCHLVRESRSARQRPRGQSPCCRSQCRTS
jgi:hypothetical protein